jgi:hypothetical protein
MATIAAEGSQPLVVYPSAARTVTPTADLIIPPKGAQGLMLWINATAIAATPSIVFAIQAVDPLTGAGLVANDILASTAVVAVSTRLLRVHPQLTAAANLIAKDMLPGAFRVLATHGDADSITYYVVAYFSY